MSEKKKLTKSIIDAAKPKTTRYRIHDTELPGFSLRIYPSGQKSYIIDYRTKDSGRQRFVTVGDAKLLTIDQARKKAFDLLNQVEQGEDPAAALQKTREVPLFKEFVEEYFDRYALHEKKESSIRSDRVVVKHLIAEFGNIRVSSITFNDASELHKKITRFSPKSKKPAPISANRVIKLLSKMMSLCELWGYREKGTNPCENVILNPENPRKRFLDPEKKHDLVTGEIIGPGELERFLKACADSLKNKSENTRDEKIRG